MLGSESLSAALADRYRLEREVGHGGMATVYLAHDLKHDRPVAVKVLRPELAAALGHERFLREIATTAPLHHPHILPLYDSGQAAGTLYYVMPFVEGESLRERLAREPQLAVPDALRITREVADALSYAHRRGIVHRDIKPENIMLENDHALVADFGIAKALRAAGGETLTQTGVAVGTAAYMSPEQWAAQPIDGRSDLYSLACVTYEMLAGHGPYYGATAQELRARHTMDPVPTLRPARATVSASLEHAVMKALAKVPADRFTSVGEFAAALAAPVVPASIAHPTRRRWGWSVAVLFAATGIAAALFLLRPKPTGAVPKIAVLPPAELPGSEADQQFAEGVTDEIADHLTNLSGLLVVSPRSATARRLATAGASQRQLSEEVGVRFALQPSIRSDQAPNGLRRVRVSLQLVRLADGTNLWAHSYTDTLTGGQIFDVQADIAQHVAQALNVTLLAAESTTLRARPTRVPAAYEAYLRGNAYARGGYGQSLSRIDRPAAVEAYRRAIDLDPGFAEAHARLAIQYVGLGQDTVAREHAQHALALDPDLAWGHLALATCFFHEENWERFRAEASAADSLAPNSAEILEATGTLYSSVDDFDRRLRNYQQAIALDPLSWQLTLDLGVTYFAIRRLAEAERYFDRAIDMAPAQPSPYVYKAWLHLSWHGSVPEASAILQTSVRRFGLDSGFTIGFLTSYWWASRLLARDPWYRGTLEQVRLGGGGLDSARYFMHKAGLYEGLGQPNRARAYWDSAAVVLGERERALVAGRKRAPVTLLEALAVVRAAQGKAEQALEASGRAVEREPSAFARGVVLALTYAELGHDEAAVEQFDRLATIPDGWVTPRFLALDPTLTPLRAVPRFRALLERR